MAETKSGSLQLTLDPITLILSHYSDPQNPDNPLHFTMERGPNYYIYSKLRESNLRSKLLKFEQNDHFSGTPTSEFTPVKKPIKAQESPLDSGKKRRSSVLAQSVPDFSSAIRKENRRPPPENRIPRGVGKCATPPMPKSGGSRLVVNSGEKQRFGSKLDRKVMLEDTNPKVVMGMGRKSYASMEELKGLSIAASNAINGENRGGGGGGGGGRRSNVLRKSTVFSSTRYY